MRLLVVAFLVTLTVASPVNIISARNQLALRQASEPCTIGYCTQNGGTTGGAGGASVTVSTVDQLVAAAQKEGPLTIFVSGALSGNVKVRVSSHKTIIGEKGSSLTNIGLFVREAKNVILRNLKISGVKAANGDAIGIDRSTNVWVDHCDLSGDLSGGKDDLDGLLDFSHASDWVTVSNVYLHDHWKGSLAGSADTNTEDKGKLHITYANNYWYNINSRTPFVRFGTVHIINSYYDKLLLSGVNPRMGAQALVQSTAFANSPARAIFSEGSTEPGFAVVEDVDLGGSQNTALKGNLTSDSLPYKIAPIGSSKVASTIPFTAGQKLY
ncbi:pectate lyase [Colletotrichum higginsianum]|uniref:Pectate lyase n=2 Tax=Colletotrichum higginsianum TaxID=80884 RepID=H1VJV6_COLHI|nr:Pectate lyase [Colletotrichum higginsianum IMI 349063]OBR11018.1 Pectate lyase [Colletotrichum higginsianum IMI 349063]TID07124.1 putative pectate lyase B [Colletotrichum higginsianum]GJD01247.1 pectate lyase [Colletotrichum higginsianum]CCF40509.1 pectate lyase [Colletotrichum higginsianum]